VFVVKYGLDAPQAARMFALTDTAAADALIGCWDAKYHYNWWRPFSAIPAGDTDGNAATPGDPTWQPLLGTPNHPEYPSAHAFPRQRHSPSPARFGAQTDAG
jgi:hypothetical protein